MIYIEDEIHAEHQGEFASFDEAIAELRRRAKLPWDRPPNVAPCTSWKTCGRNYAVVELDTSEQPPQIRREYVLEVSAAGVKWADGFDEAP